MSIQAAYTDWSTTYDTDRNRTRDLDQIVTQKSLGHLRCNTLLEIGCGTGKNTSFLATLGEQVLALDFSMGMLQRAKAKWLAPQVLFAIANLTEPWPCQAQGVDLIVCNLVLEHIQDLSFIFDQADRVLVGGGQFFICELHPFRQYQGTVANFEWAEQKMTIPAFTHHLSDFSHAARQNRFALKDLNEWWHADDEHKPPRLVSFLFEKALGPDSSNPTSYRRETP